MKTSAALAAAFAVPLLVAGCMQPRAEVGRAFYDANCAACHGADGRGAAGVEVPDLSTFAARNGGVFDRTKVMSMIDGYLRRDDPSHPMPEFGAVLGGRVVMIETGPGVLTPAPEILVALADHLETLQR